MIRWLIDPYDAAFMRNAALVALMVGVLAPTVGVWVVLRRVAYLGDAMSHATLAGVAGAYLVGTSVVVGALTAGLALGLTVTALERWRRVSADAAIGIVETLLFATGVLLVARNDGIGVDLSHLLFGQIVTVTTSELVVNGVLTVVALGVVAVTFADLRALVFDPVHARQVGVPVGALGTVLTALIAISVVVSFGTVGLAMSVAMLVTPAATARLCTDRTATMTAVAVACGTTSALGGLTLSYHLATPPGPTIALSAVAWFVVVAAVTLPRRRRGGRAQPRPAQL